MPLDRTLRRLPCLDPFDDEQTLAGLDESEPPRLTDERGVARGGGELVLQLLLLAAKRFYLRGPLDERVSCVQVRLQRPVVEEADQAERADPEPPADEHGAARSTAAFLHSSRHGRPSSPATGAVLLG